MLNIANNWKKYRVKERGEFLKDQETSARWADAQLQACEKVGYRRGATERFN